MDMAHWHSWPPSPDFDTLHQRCNPVIYIEQASYSSPLLGADPSNLRPDRYYIPKKAHPLLAPDRQTQYGLIIIIMHPTTPTRQFGRGIPPIPYQTNWPQSSTHSGARKGFYDSFLTDRHPSFPPNYLPHDKVTTAQLLRCQFNSSTAV